MNYEKEYKDAIKRAKAVLEIAANKEEAEGYVSTIFPELKESEDEKIVNAIRKALESKIEDLGNGVTKTACLAWLEKQGEQKKSYDTCDSSMMDNKKSPYGEKRDFGYFEEKPADKVEPKFKAGDWAVNNNSGGVYQVTEIRDDEYCLWPLDGEIMGYLRIIDVDNDYHLWTIKDAKDGDVLWHSDSASNGIFIFKEIRYVDGKVLCYCDYDSEDHFCTGEHHTCCWSNAKYIKPATKEQRDTLEKAMTDAGYIFDFDKKELKKIENPIAWSEEDEDMIQALNACIDATIKSGMHYISFGSKNILIGKVKNWLKSLKDRIQPKQEWSEEDEVTRNALINLVEMYYGGCIDKSEKNRLLSRLKSLRPQSTWKPSGEQMEFVWKYAEQNNYDGKVFTRLYNDLKKLKE